MTAKRKNKTEKLGNVVVMHVEVGRMQRTKAERYLKNTASLMRKSLNAAGDKSQLVVFPMLEGKRTVNVEILPLHI